MVRTKIQAIKLIDLLEKHALGTIDLNASRIKAIEILLKKTVPDLQSVELTGDSEKPIEHRIITGVPND